MNIITKYVRIYKWKISLAALLWFLLAIIGVALKIRLGYKTIGNYVIFKTVFWHTLHQSNLYRYYPAENLGSYLYGPLFSLVIAPFAVLPVSAGAFLWGIFNAAILFIAIEQLPVSPRKQHIILLVSAIEMMTSLQNMQINCLVTALVIFTFTSIKKENVFWAAFFVAAGFLVKIYGVAGIGFILFSKNKIQFILYFLLWLAILFCLPMLISSPAFIYRSYIDWYHTLVVKDTANLFSEMQNISVMGMLRRIFNIIHENTLIIFIASLFYLLPLFRKKQLMEINFQLSYLAFLLIGIVIFSTSAESPTYIIAVTGVGIWFVIQDINKLLTVSLVLITFLFTSLSSTDFFPHHLKANFIQPYAIKALPCILVWIILAFQLLLKEFKVAAEENSFKNLSEKGNSQI
jgi:hypothetical protein